MQSTARKNELPLDKMCLVCEVTKKCKEEMTQPPKEGACIHGLYMEGARWDINTNAIGESFLKDLYPLMPVMLIKAVTQDKAEVLWFLFFTPYDPGYLLYFLISQNRNMYDCPVYKTRERSHTYIWTFNLRSREKPSKWVLAGVCLLLQI